MKLPDNPTYNGILDVGWGRKIDVSKAQPQGMPLTTPDISLDEQILAVQGSRDGMATVPMMGKLVSHLDAAAVTLRRVKSGELVPAPSNLTAIPIICTCSGYRRGELTGGWICPTHGHQL